MTTPSAQVVCKIQCPGALLATALAGIVETCAHDTGQPVRLRTLPPGGEEPTVTLCLPVELAATQHQVWCLACRLACFCPGVRVSVLIRGENAFNPRRQNRRSA